jgi:glycolate oxidase FAD binding subunit
VTVAGVVPREVVSPGTTGEVADLLRSTTGTIVPVGAGTKTGWAAPPASCDLVLSTAGLNRIVEHAPGDLVVIAEAGVPLAALQERLTEHGQMLALDPPEPGATLGGVLSANASGPRRLRYGTVRDLLIGVTVVLADGTTAHSGGKVVKNVAGYDLGKLYTGAHGSLGVVTSTTWRLHPRPPAAGIVTVPVADPAEAGRLAALLSRSVLTPTAVELRWDGDAGELVVLFESTEASVDAQSTAASTLLGGGERGRTTPDWFGQRPSGGIVLRLAHEPHALPHVLSALPRGAFGTASACTGVAYLSVSEDSDLTGLRAAIARYDGSAVVIDAPEHLRGSIDHWGPVPDSFGLMTRVKDQFDPGRRLSPGRLLGGL